MYSLHARLSLLTFVALVNASPVEIARAVQDTTICYTFPTTTRCDTLPTITTRCDNPYIETCSDGGWTTSSGIYPTLIVTRKKSKYNSVHPAIQRREFSMGQFHKELDDKPVGSRSSKNKILNIIKSLRCATVHLRPLSMLLHGVQSTYDVRIR